MVAENLNCKPLHFFCSWSGGKDSCLALYRMIKEGHICKSLFTMIDETGEHSRSHGLTPDLLKAQAGHINIPVITGNAGWSNYDLKFKKCLGDLKSQGVENGVFGDIDLEPHREWVERVCSECGFKAHLPLWLENRRELVSEFINEGFKALIVVVNTNKMPEMFLGRVIDFELIDELESIGVDACGENGEFHTFVYDGPLFSRPVEYTIEKSVYHQEYRFLKLTNHLE